MPAYYAMGYLSGVLFRVTTIGEHPHVKTPNAIGGRLVGIGRCLTALSPPQNGACDLHRTPLKHLKGRVKDPSA